MSYRVVYGETMPAWERIFPTLPDAKVFTRKQRRLGDIIFSVRKVRANDKPQSLIAAIEKEERRVR